MAAVSPNHKRFIQQLQKKLGLNKSSFAKKLGISRPALDDIYSGKTKTLSERTSLNLKNLQRETERGLINSDLIEKTISVNTEGSLVVLNFVLLTDAKKKDLMDYLTNNYIVDSDTWRLNN